MAKQTDGSLGQKWAQETGKYPVTGKYYWKPGQNLYLPDAALVLAWALAYLKMVKLEFLQQIETLKVVWGALKLKFI